MLEIKFLDKFDFSWPERKHGREATTATNWISKQAKKINVRARSDLFGFTFFLSLFF